MKKFFLIILSFFACSLSAEVDMQFDQFYLTVTQYSYIYSKAMELCKEKNYKFFKFIKVMSTDGVGDTITISNNFEDDNGDLIKKELVETNIPFGPWNCSFEIMCYKEKPKSEILSDKIIINVEDYWEKVERSKAFALSMEKDTSIKEITTLEELEKDIASTDGIVLVDCYSACCGPCQQLYPIFKQCSEDCSNKAIFLKVNISNDNDIANTYHIKSVPTLLVFNNNKLQDRKIGLPEISKYLESIRE